MNRSCRIFGEKTLALAKSILPFLPYGKAVALASILIEKFPTTATTRTFYASARPRWRRAFVFRLNPCCPLSKLFALTGLYQPEMTAKLLKSKQRGAFVDIGANFGYFSVLWLSKRNTNVIAIEPILQNYELLIGNLRNFGSRARSVFCCLGEEPGEVSMSYDPQYPMLSKICADPAEGQRVEMRTLLDVLEENEGAVVEVLKCDAEGYDIRTLSSAHEIFEKRRVLTLFFERETFDGQRDSGLEKFCHILASNGYRQVSETGAFDLCYSVFER
jgi:FkbM family methyltransferase